MQPLKLNLRPEITNDSKFSKQMHVFQQLLDEIGTRDIPQPIFQVIADKVDKLNAMETADLKKKLSQSQLGIVRMLEKELKLVPKGYYQTLWMALGMSAFGLPIGVAIGAALGNMAFLAIGLPIGMPIGMAIGMSMDRKAAQEGRQLNVNLNG